MIGTREQYVRSNVVLKYFDLIWGSSFRNWREPGSVSWITDRRVEIRTPDLPMFSCGAHASAASLSRFLDHTQRRTTLGRTPLNQWSARRRGRYMTTHDEHKRRIFMPSAGFEPAISAMEQNQKYLRPRCYRDRLSGNVTLWAATFGRSAKKVKGKNVEGGGLDQFCLLNPRGKRMYHVL
jgi:hypothetical protein